MKEQENGNLKIEIKLKNLLKNGMKKTKKNKMVTIILIKI
jgi:hypothetical protein